MKEVATGNATQDQLKVFQNHIDELTKIITEQKKKEDEDEATSAEAAKATAQQSEMIQYDGVADTVPPPAYQQPQNRPYHPPALPYQQPQQQPWVPPPPPAPAPAPAPTALPVILAFTTPGATEDRFLFPQHSILEALSPQHLLTSFIVTRKGRDAVDPAGLDPDAEYWQPVTLMVEVAYNREHILECVRRWVKPAEEVTKHMEEVMGRCTRAPDSYLALRLPFKGSAMAETDDALTSGAGTPVTAVEEKMRMKPKSSVKYIKKALKNEVGKEKSETKSESGEKKVGETADVASTPQAAAKEASSEQNGTVTATVTATNVGDETKDDPATTETGRPRRAVRKSVRISEA